MSAPSSQRPGFRLSRRSSSHDPFDARVAPGLQLREVHWTVANSGQAVGADDTPARAGRFVEKLFAVT